MRIDIILDKTTGTFDVEVDGYATDASVVRRGYRFVGQVGGIDVTREWGSPYSSLLTREIIEAVEAGDITVFGGAS